MPKKKPDNTIVEKISKGRTAGLLPPTPGEFKQVKQTKREFDAPVATHTAYVPRVGDSVEIKTVYVITRLPNGSDPFVGVIDIIGNRVLNFYPSEIQKVS